MVEQNRIRFKMIVILSYRIYSIYLLTLFYEAKNLRGYNTDGPSYACNTC